jgi:hypothetical protein
MGIHGYTKAVAGCAAAHGLDTNAAGLNGPGRGKEGAAKAFGFVGSLADDVSGCLAGVDAVAGAFTASGSEGQDDGCDWSSRRRSSCAEHKGMWERGLHAVCVPPQRTRGMRDAR